MVVVMVMVWNVEAMVDVRGTDERRRGAGLSHPPSISLCPLLLRALGATPPPLNQQSSSGQHPRQQQRLPWPWEGRRDPPAPDPKP